MKNGFFQLLILLGLIFQSANYLFLAIVVLPLLAQGVMMIWDNDLSTIETVEN